MSYMFSGCNSLTSLPDISKWNTIKVTNMKSMFCNCKSLTSYSEISKWKIDNVIDISEIFRECNLYLIFQIGTQLM